MRKEILVFFQLLLPVLLNAQIIISVQLPPAGSLQRDQLWNLVLSNNSNNAFDATIVLNLQSATNGQTVLTATTPQFTLAKGMKVMSAQNVQPVQYTYNAANLTSNFLPLGRYVACYTLFRNQSDLTEKMAEECVQVNIDPLSPPLLLSPADKSVLTPGALQLAWIAPAPMDLFDEISYELNVTEVLSGQSPSQAIQYNVPIYRKERLKTLVDYYPSSLTKFEAGKTYAWQVLAKNGIDYQVPTEIWTFRLADDTTQTIQNNTSYVLLSNNINQAVATYVTDSLFIKYYSFDKAHEATVEFRSPDGTLLDQKKQQLIYGDNFLVFPLSRRFEKGPLYRLELSDLQNTKYTIFFRRK